MSDGRTTASTGQPVYSDDPMINGLLTRVVAKISSFFSGPALAGKQELDNLLARVVAEIKSFTEGQVVHIHELVKIGQALSAEKNLDRLLEMIVSEARRFTNADGGTLYIKKELEEALDFSIVQNDSLDVRMGGTGKQITWPSVPLVTEEGRKNERNVSAYCAIYGKAINIKDVYDAEGFDFQGTKDFDKTTGYRSKSMLVIPMRDHEDEVIGVLQLLNARDRKSGEVVSFAARDEESITSLASSAAIAVTNVRLIKGLEDLLHAFVKSIASAIDEKSPYTAGHILRVASLTESIAEAISRADSGIYKDLRFSSDEMAEIRLAAWMHDVGKICTPEYVVDKSAKLETIFDRIELIRHKLEIIKRDAEISLLRRRLGEEATAPPPDDLTTRMATLEEDLRFLGSVNIGGEFLSDESVRKIEELKRHTYLMAGKKMPLLTEDELENLLVRSGTLTDRERNIINNHVTITIKMLESLPFPKKLRHVPLYAGMHHEKLDGSGYPRGLKQEDIDIRGRIIAVADIFEALTAADRPYKKAKKLSESMRILGFMVKDKHLDEALCDFLVENGLITKYAAQYLQKEQLDEFEWKGKRYSVESGD